MLDLTKWTDFDITIFRYKYISDSVINIEIQLTNKDKATYLLNRTLQKSSIDNDFDLAIWIVSQLNQDVGIYFEDKTKKDKIIKTTCTIDASGNLILDSVS